MAHSVQPSLPTRTKMQVQQQMQMQQHLQANAPLPVPIQPAPRHMQVLALPVVVAKPKTVEKPRRREKRIFVVAEHQHCVMSNLASLWKSGKLCDASIGNGSSNVMVHKLVLYAVCPKLLYVSNLDIMSPEFLQVNFPGEVSTEALNAFAEYMYNGTLDLDRDILEQLKIIAKRLDLKEFEQLCNSHLPNHMNQPVSAAAAPPFTNVVLIQTTAPIPAMTSSLGATISTSMQSAPSITTHDIDIKQEISETKLTKVKKEAATVSGQESEVASLAPNKSRNAAGSVISPIIKTEQVGPEDDKYGYWSGCSSNHVFPSTTSSSSSSSIAATASTSITSVPASSTEFAIPFSETTDVKSTRLKATHSYKAPFVSDLSPVSFIVETMQSQSLLLSSINKGSSKPSSQPSDSLPSVDLSNSNDTVYPVRLLSARGDNLPMLTTHSSDAMMVNSFIPSEKT